MSSEHHHQPDPGQFGPGPFDPGQPAPGQFGPSQPGAEQFGSSQPWPGQFGPQQAGWQPPPYGPGPYVQVGAGWPQAAGRRTNSLAIAALCCAIGQVIAGPFAGIAAIVLGALSLKQIRMSGEDGRGMAITSLVLGVIGTILFVIVIAVIVAVAQSTVTDFNNVGNLGS